MPRKGGKRKPPLKKPTLGPALDSYFNDDEPKPRGRKRKPTEPVVDLKGEAIRYETDEECKERYYSVIEQTLHVMGDEPRPHPESVDLAFGVASSSISYLLQDVTPRAENALQQILQRMKARPDLIGRLLRYTEVVGNLRSLKANNSQAFNANNEFDDDSEAFQGSTSTNYLQELASAIDALKWENFDAQQLMMMEDPVSAQRLEKLAARVKDMEMDEYEALTSARQATFWTLGFDLNIKKSTIERKSFLNWIGWEEAPQIIVFVLNFVAKETVKQLADFASRVIEMQRDKGEPVIPFDPSIYRMAFFRSARARNGDFMFGALPNVD
ncbi:unnamed protein product, partial [Mesorhabditis belari]|uniref:Uncharacterized protein n=1 Tax=Mesorhabditis belari TaxID=2138241 RepID=A0AAF3EG92_9BILA